MSIDDLKQNWERFGEENPLWAVHTGRERWDEDEFLRSGRESIDRVKADLARAGVAELPVPSVPDRVLDFGCGVGRLSLALAETFDRVEGVDISGPMVEKARELAEARLGDSQERVGYRVNDAPDLAVFEDGRFGMALSLICLQHMKPDLARGYIAEFCRVTAPDGIVFFQIPSRRSSAALRVRGAIGRTARRLAGRLRGEAVMEMYGIPRPEIERILDANGVEVLGVFPNELAATWESYSYVGRRRES